jgi:hypothetical protein
MLIYAVALLYSEGRDSQYSDWAMGWMIGLLGLDSWWGLEILLFTTVLRPALESTQPPIQWVIGALFLGVKWLGCEADNSPPSSAKVKNAWSYTSTSLYVFMVWHLSKHRDDFTFTFYCLYSRTTS